jgi:CBS domain-containing protein
MIVGDLMTRELVTALPETSLADAARMMLARHVSGLPVVDKGGHLIGMVTEGDLLRRTELDTDGEAPNWLMAFLMPSRLADDYVKTHGRHVGEVMSLHPMTVTPQTSLETATGLMRRKHVKRLPVLEDGRLVGVIARSDLLKALALKLIETHGKTNDKAIGEHIMETLARERWAPKSGIRVTVSNAVVDIEGVVFSDSERRAVMVIAETTPGVKDVTDHLVYVDPGSGMSIPAA